MGSVVFSSSYSSSIAGYATYNVRVGFSESYDISTNRTTISVSSVEIQKEGNSTNWGWLPVFGRIKVNGVTLLDMNGGSSVRVSLDGSGYCPVNIPSSASTTVTHNDDGSQSVTFALDGRLSFGGSDYTGAAYNGTPFGAADQSQSVALTTRPRASAISSCSSSVATLGTFSLTVSRNAPAFWHKATIRIGNTTMYTSGAFAASMTYTVPRAWFSSCPTGTSLTATVSVQTYTDASCATAVGSAVTRDFTVTADADMKPVLSPGWVSLAADNVGTAVAGVTNGYVKGFSKAKATFNSACVTQAAGTLSSGNTYSVVCQGSTASGNPACTPVLNAASVQVVCTVTDSRGRSASEYFTLSAADYAKPALSGISVYRCDGNGNADEAGTFCSVTATGSFSPVGTNACSLVCAVAAAGGTYGSGTALTSGVRKIVGPISADASYAVRITATDTVGNSAVYYASIPTRKWAMKFRPDGNGVAFGKAAETDKAFEITDEWILKLGENNIKSLFVRPNLLGNWYFAGGGSQQGGGQFPVNQRGKTSYSIPAARTNCIDRWFGYDGGGSGTIQVSSRGVVLTKTGGYDGMYFGQTNVAEDLTGKTVTLSLLTSDGALFTGTGVVPKNFIISAYPNIAANVTIENNRTVVQFYCYAASLTVVAAKLEIGETQTLAHRENGAWVLNEAPNYAVELEKCQRHQLNLNPNTIHYGVIGYAFGVSATEIEMLIPTPCEMARNVSFEGYANLLLSELDYSNPISPTAATCYRMGTGIKVIFTVSGAAANKLYLAHVGTSSSLFMLSSAQ